MLAAEKRAVDPGAPVAASRREEGYRAETERGLAPGDKSRNYVDDWPKPEILCALTSFEVLAGMRLRADAAALLRRSGYAELEPLAAELAAASRPRGRSPARSRTILTWPAADEGCSSTAVVAACERVAADGGEYAAACAATAQIAARPPGRPRHRRLAAAAARGAAARRGGLHAGRRPARVPARHGHRAARQLRQRGPGRAHPKHIDVPELLQARSTRRRRCRSSSRGRLAAVCPPTTPRPRSSACTGPDSGGGEAAVPGDGGPRIVLCTDGTGTLHGGAGTLKLVRGESCFIPASDGAVTVSGPADLFIAGCGIDLYISGE